MELPPHNPPEWDRDEDNNRVEVAPIEDIPGVLFCKEPFGFGVDGRTFLLFPAEYTPTNAPGFVTAVDRYLNFMTVHESFFKNCVQVDKPSDWNVVKIHELKNPSMDVYSNGIHFTFGMSVHRFRKSEIPLINKLLSVGVMKFNED